MYERSFCKFCKNELLSPIEIEIGYHDLCYSEMYISNPEFKLIDILTPESRKILDDLKNLFDLPYHYHSSKSVLLQHPDNVRKKKFNFEPGLSEEERTRRERLKYIIELILRNSKYEGLKEVKNIFPQRMSLLSYNDEKLLWNYIIKNHPQQTQLNPNLSKFSPYDQTLIKSLLLSTPFSKVIFEKDYFIIRVTPKLSQKIFIFMCYKNNQYKIKSCNYMRGALIIFSMDFTRSEKSSLQLSDFLHDKRYGHDENLIFSIILEWYMYSNFQNFFTKKLIKQIKDTQQAVNLPLFSFSSNVLTFQYSKGVGWNKYDKSIIQFHINNSKIKALVIQNLDQQRTEKVLEKDWEYIKKVDIEIIDVKNPKFVMENFKHFTRIDNLDLCFRFSESPEWSQYYVFDYRYLHHLQLQSIRLRFYSHYFMNAMLINYPQQLTLKFLSLINVDLPILTKCNINKLVLFNQSVFTNAKINFNNLPENLETLVIDCLFLNTNENLAKIILNKKFDNIKNIILSSKYYGYEEIIKNSEVKNHFFSYFSNAIIRTEDKEVTEINE